MKRELSRLQLIERSLITTYRSKIFAKFIKAIKEYELLSPNDHVCVCISGGKDSMVMAKCFQELKRHSDFPFEVTYMVMNPGYSKPNLERIIENAKTMNIPITIVNSDIFEIVTTIEKNPCYLCAKMRRGVLYKNAQSLGCNKIALGHHFDDVIETTMLNLFYAGSIKGMMPKVKSANYEGMELIRPLYLVREKDIIAFKNYNSLEFLRCACRFTENVANNEMESKRLEVKNLIKELKKDNPFVEANIFSSIANVNIDKVIKYTKNGKETSFLEEYDENLQDE